MQTFRAGLNAACETAICFSILYSELNTFTTVSRATVLVFAITSILRVEVSFAPFAGVIVTQSASHDASQEILPSTVTLLVVPSTDAEIDSVLTLNTGLNASCEIAICFSILYSAFETLITASRATVLVFSATSTLTVVAVPFLPLAGVIVTQSASHDASQEILLSTVTFLVVPEAIDLMLSVSNSITGSNFCCLMLKVVVVLCSLPENVIVALRTSIAGVSSTVIESFFSPLLPEFADAFTHDSLDITE